MNSGTNTDNMIVIITSTNESHMSSSSTACIPHVQPVNMILHPSFVHSLLLTALWPIMEWWQQLKWLHELNQWWQSDITHFVNQHHKEVVDALISFFIHLILFIRCLECSHQPSAISITSSIPYPITLITIPYVLFS